MAMTEQRKKYLLDYQKEKLKRVPLDLPLEDYDKVKKYAEDHGESVNGLIKRLLRQELGEE